MSTLYVDFRSPNQLFLLLNAKLKTCVAGVQKMDLRLNDKKTKILFFNKARIFDPPNQTKQEFFTKVNLLGIIFRFIFGMHILKQ